MSTVAQFYAHNRTSNQYDFHDLTRLSKHLSRANRHFTKVRAGKIAFDCPAIILRVDGTVGRRKQLSSWNCLFVVFFFCFSFRSPINFFLVDRWWKIHQQQYECGWLSDVTQRLNFSRLQLTFHESQFEAPFTSCSSSETSDFFYIVFKAFSFFRCFNCFVRKKVLLISRNRNTAPKKLSRKLLFFFTRLT